MGRRADLVDFILNAIRKDYKLNPDPTVIGLLVHEFDVITEQVMFTYNVIVYIEYTCSITVSVCLLHRTAPR